ncbi:hypothetical protein [Paraliobacillus sediminis]|uniref:hypothetical protein n=1 Tax=Paraliobacillus sediminis TaxID=1885916 RepID=UPI000E3DF617|nr:hypothetical protein [Paraliobacillus sediminis]
MYEWLKTFKEIQEEIDVLVGEIYQTETELKRWVVGDLQNVKLKWESKGAQVEEYLKKQMADLFHKEKEMDELIRLVKTFKGLDNQVLRLKYIDGLTLELIGEELNYSTQYIGQVHAELLRKIKGI